MEIVDLEVEDNEVVDLERDCDIERENAGNLDDIVTESVDKRKETIYCEGEQSILIGLVVDCEMEAYDLYNNYARQVGFGVKKASTKYRSGTKNLRSKEYRCCMSGEKDKKRAEGRKFTKLDVRTNCPAMIRFTIDVVGHWEVTAHLLFHNHPFAEPDQVHLLRSHRNVPKEKLDYLSHMTDNGIQISKAFRFLTAESGGKSNVGFIERDAYSVAAKKRKEHFYGTDANTLLVIFNKRKDIEEDFFYDFELDDEERLCNFFWRDGRMRVDYYVFGDLVVHDTTYRTNKYNMICAPFVGMNNHGFNIMFG